MLLQVLNSKIYNGADAPVTVIAQKVRQAGLLVWSQKQAEIEKVDATIENRNEREWPHSATHMDLGHL